MNNARQYSAEELISALKYDYSREQTLLLLSKIMNNARPYSAEELISALKYDYSREHTLLLLSKMRTRNKELGQLLWNSNGTIFLLLKEIMQVYTFLSPPNLTEKAANRVCNVLALIQCVAAHPNTRMKFIEANIQEYVYPLIDTSSQERSFEYLRLTSLGVFGALLKGNEIEVAKPLVQGDIIPKLILCLNLGNLLSKTMAALVLEKILSIGEDGLDYCCVSAERFYVLTRALGQTVEELSLEPSHRLLKLLISCYAKLSQNPRACDCLRLCFPMKLRDSTFLGILGDDPEALMTLQALVETISTNRRNKSGMSFTHFNSSAFSIMPRGNHHN